MNFDVLLEMKIIFCVVCSMVTLKSGRKDLNWQIQFSPNGNCSKMATMEVSFAWHSMTKSLLVDLLIIQFVFGILKITSNWLPSWKEDIQIWVIGHR